MLYPIHDNHVDPAEYFTLTNKITKLSEELAELNRNKMRMISNENFITFPCCNLTYPLSALEFIEQYYYSYDERVLNSFSGRVKCPNCSEEHHLVTSLVELKYNFGSIKKD